MSMVCEVTDGGKHEIVIVEDEIAQEAHRSLFHFSDENYVPGKNGDIFQTLKQVIEKGALKIHLVGSWAWILRFATGKNNVNRGEVFFVLKSCGLTEDELRPFRDAQIEDIFHFLYYGKRFEILRKLCHKTKSRTEKSIDHEGVRIYCHIVSAISRQIVASSL